REEVHQETAAEADRVRQLARAKRRSRLCAKSIRDALDLGAELRQLLLDRLVAAVYVIDPLHVRTAFGDQSSEHQARRGPEVRGHDRCGGEAVDAADDRRIALETDLRAKPTHLEHVHEAVLENRLDDGADAVRHRVERRKLRLHVGRKSGIGCRAYVDGAGTTAPHIDLHPVVSHTDPGARFLQLHEHCIEVVRTRVLDPHVAARDGAGDQVSAALYSIGQDVVRGAAEPLDALDHDLVGAGALDLRTHRDQELCEIDDFRLTGRVLDDGLALRERGRHHQVLGARDRHGIEHETRAPQPAGARPDVTAFDRDIGAQRLQPRNVYVDGPRTDRAAAGQRYVGPSVAGHEGAEHEDGRPHGLDQLIGRKAVAHRRRIDFDAHALID